MVAEDAQEVVLELAYKTALIHALEVVLEVAQLVAQEVAQGLALDARVHVKVDVWDAVADVHQSAIRLVQASAKLNVMRLAWMIAIITAM